jgi:hypothetical protein
MFKGGDSVAKKPATPVTQVATAPTDSPTPYQPSDPTIASGAGIPSAITNATTPTNPGGLGASNPNPQGVIPGIVGQKPNPIQNRATPPQTSRANASTSFTGVNPSSLDPFKNRDGQQTGSKNQPNSAAEKNRQDQVDAENRRKFKNNADEDNRLTSSKIDNSIRRTVNNPGRPSKTNNGEETGTRGQSSRNQISQQTPLANPVPLNESSTAGQDIDLSNGGSNIFPPPSTSQGESPKNLEAPIISSDPVQVKGVQEYFQKIWRADPKFDGDLQYRVSVGRNGKVTSLEGLDDQSRFYLSKTNFLKPGEKVSKIGQQNQNVLLFLYRTGEVNTIADGE